MIFQKLQKYHVTPQQIRLLKQIGFQLTLESKKTSCIANMQWKGVADKWHLEIKLKGPSWDSVMYLFICSFVLLIVIRIPISIRNKLYCWSQLLCH